jgi:hypothetical protein
MSFTDRPSTYNDLDTSFLDQLSTYNNGIVHAWPAGVTDTPLPSHAFAAWLWEIDPTTECTVTLQLNSSHLLGLLIGREVALNCNSGSNSCSVAGFDFAVGTNMNTDPALAQFVLHTGPWRDLTLRQLRDTVQNLQVNWITHNAAAIPAVLPYLNQLFVQFANLSMQHGVIDKDMDDQGSVEDSYGAVRLNAACLRRFLNVFLVMYRNILLQFSCKHLEADSLPIDCGIQKHHIFAGVDDFHVISMNWDLMVSAKLVYMHDFSGMFNCVSQVVFFHDHNYQRRPPSLQDIEAIASGTAENTEHSALFTLPSLLQLYPEVPLIFDDCHGLRDKKWRWLLMGRRFYMMDPQHNLYYHTNITVLMSLYLSKHKT